MIAISAGFSSVFFFTDGFYAFRGKKLVSLFQQLFRLASTFSSPLAELHISLLPFRIFYIENRMVIIAFLIQCVPEFILSVKKNLQKKEKKEKRLPSLAREAVLPLSTKTTDRSALRALALLQYSHSADLLRKLLHARRRIFYNRSERSFAAAQDDKRLNLTALEPSPLTSSQESLQLPFRLFPSKDTVFEAGS